jgi:hypothetical protein
MHHEVIHNTKVTLEALGDVNSHHGNEDTPNNQYPESFLDSKTKFPRHTMELKSIYKKNTTFYKLRMSIYEI